jgi:hypothetical protein
MNKKYFKRSADNIPPPAVIVAGRYLTSEDGRKKEVCLKKERLKSFD